MSSDFTQLDRELKRFSRLKKQFKPKFSWVDSIEEAARMINAPHVDDLAQQPERTDRTKSAIAYIRQWRSVFPCEISWSFAQKIHYKLWRNLNPKNIIAGDFRKHNVTLGVGGKMFPRYEFLEQLKSEVFPADPQTEAELIEWYCAFESLHPFGDGNGRVGGVIVAALSNCLRGGWYLAPHQ